MPLPLRTIVVSTRAAVKRHQEGGNDLLIRASVERGLALLDQLEGSLPPEASAETRQLHDDARRQLGSLLVPAGDPVSCPG